MENDLEKLCLFGEVDLKFNKSYHGITPISITPLEEEEHRESEEE